MLMYAYITVKYPRYAYIGVRHCNYVDAGQLCACVTAVWERGRLTENCIFEKYDCAAYSVDVLRYSNGVKIVV